MKTKTINSTTQSYLALIAESPFPEEHIPVITLSNEIAEYGSWLSAKVIWIAQEGQSMHLSSETILQKILDFCSNEIIQLDEVQKQITVIGQENLDFLGLSE